MGENGIYPYKPSQPGAILFAVLFGLSAVLHLFQMIKAKAWYYGPLTAGAVMMTIGYLARYLSSLSPAELGPYILQSLFIILPPSLYAASIYMIYGRLVVFVDAAEASVIAPHRVTKIFVCGDVVAFFLQAGGGGLMAQADMSNIGQAIMLIGLFVQLIFFGLFLVISIIFMKRMRGSVGRLGANCYGASKWTALLYLLLGAAVVIILRCIFRIVEFAQGHNGYLASHEIYIYLFDTAPMLGVQVMFHFVRASNIFGAHSFKQMKDQESAVDLSIRT